MTLQSVRVTTLQCLPYIILIKEIKIKKTLFAAQVRIPWMEEQNIY